MSEVAWSWAGHDFICSQHVFGRLNGIGDHFGAKPVEISYKRLKPGGRLYEAIREKGFVWPVPRKTISIDPIENGLVEMIECAVCGLRRFEFKMTDLRIDRSTIVACDAFCIREVGRNSPVFVTEEYKRRLDDLGVENIGYREAGWAR